MVSRSARSNPGCEQQPCCCVRLCSRSYVDAAGLQRNWNEQAWGCRWFWLALELLPHGKDSRQDHQPCEQQLFLLVYDCTCEKPRPRQTNPEKAGILWQALDGSPARSMYLGRLKASSHVIALIQE